MKIEVDTKHDSREELAHVAELLQKLARSSRNGAVVTESKPGNIFDDPAPTGGMFSMFGDDSTPSTPAEPSPAQSSEPASGGLFSIFNSSESSAPSASGTSAQPSAAELLASSDLVEEEDEGEKSGVQDILDDDRIVPY